MCNAAKHQPVANAASARRTRPVIPLAKVASGQKKPWTTRRWRAAALQKWLGTRHPSRRSFSAICRSEIQISPGIRWSAVSANSSGFVGRSSRTFLKIGSLFLSTFGAPAVDGAWVELSEGESLTGGAGWSVKVFGIGTGDSATLQVSKARTYVAKAGTCKIVLVPVKLRVAHVAVFDRDRLLGRGYQLKRCRLQRMVTRTFIVASVGHFLHPIVRLVQTRLTKFLTFPWPATRAMPCTKTSAYGRWT